MPEFLISDRLVGGESDPLVIAEIGINHEGSLDVALEIAQSAIDAGAEVIKHQTHVVEDEMSEEAKWVKPGNADVSIYEIMARCALSENDERTLKEFVESQGRIFISTPFSRLAVERLGRLDVPAVKVGSGECNNLPLIKLIIELGKPVILSTGMNSIDSVQETVSLIRAAGLPYVLLHTTNLYPTPHHLVRLGAMQELAEHFPDAVIGLSDHTVDSYSSLAAVALGAQVLERHFTDRFDRPGPDIRCSMGPDELKALITGAKVIKATLGGSKLPAQEEEVTSAFAFASVVAIKDIHVGDLLTERNVWVMRPSGGGYSARDYASLLGGTATVDVPAGRQLPPGSVLLPDGHP